MNGTRRWILVLSLMGLATVAVSAIGTAEVSIQASPATVSGTYDVDTELVLPEIVTVGVSGGITGRYALGFSEGASGDFAARTLIGPGGVTMDYQIFDNAVDRLIIKDLVASPDASELITGTAIIGGTDVPFEAAVLQSQMVPPGLYQDSVTVLLYEGANGVDGLKETAPMGISVDVPAFVTLSLVTTGGAFDPALDTMTLDFGALAQGGQRDMEVLVRANVNFGVDVESANLGSLSNIDIGDPSTVPYQMTVDASPVDLSAGPVNVVSDVGPTPLGGNRYAVVFTIGSLGGASAGAYEDVLTVTVTAQ